jgi:hypothetical protein
MPNRQGPGAMKIASMFSRHARQWRCPGCNQVSVISGRKDDPLLCRGCLKQEKSRRRRETLMAPFRDLSRAIRLLGFLLLGAMVLLVLLVLISPRSNTPHPRGIQRSLPNSSASSARKSPSPPPSSSSGADRINVPGYYRKDNTYVRPHTRSRPGTRGK